MGTSIELKICNVSLDYAKNLMGNDYGFLFQEADMTRMKSDSVDYEYYEEHPEESSELEVSELVFSRSLARVIPRLNLLGHSLEAARAEYKSLINEQNSLLDEVSLAHEKKTG